MAKTLTDTKSINAAIADPVIAGQQIAAMGNTGSAGANHNGIRQLNALGWMLEKY